MTAVSRISPRNTGQIFHIRRLNMTNHGRIISDIQTTDPDSKNIKTKYFRGTDGVFNGKGGCHCV